MARVSILLTCYNHVKYLPAALDGIRNQTFKDFEIIALDDGSTDGSREWLSEQPDLQLVFNEKNLGTYGTLNEGLRRATGEFVAVLNDDDVWLPEKLERQVELLDSHPEVALVHTGGYFIDGEGDQQEGNPLGFRFPTFETGDISVGLVYENKIIASAALARRDVLAELGGFNSRYFGSGDWEMWFRVAEMHHVGFVDGPLTLYRVHGENASHKLERIWKDDQMLREWMMPRIEHWLSESWRVGADHLVAVKQALAFNHAALGTVRMLNGDAQGARASYAQSIRLEPGRWKSYARYVATFLGKKTFWKLK